MASGSRKRTGFLLIVVALVLILAIGAGAFLLRDRLFARPSASQDTTAPQQPRVEMVNIVVLAQPVPRGTAIAESMLAMVAYPRNQMVEGLFYTDAAQVINKRTRFDLEQGVPLTPSLLTDAQQGSYASFQVPKGMVAISIPISRLTSVSYALQSGDHVNVIASFLLVDLDADYQTRLPNNSTLVTAPGKVAGEGEGGEVNSLTIGIQPGGAPQGRFEIDPVLGPNAPMYSVPSEAQRPRLVSQTLVQDAVVLWVGEFPLGQQQAVGQSGEAAPTPTPVPQTGEAQQAPAKPEIITLIVSPQDAVSLNYLMLTGAKLNLVLRSAGDNQASNTEAVTLQFIMDQYNFPVPAKLPYGMEPANTGDLLYPPTSSQPAATQPQQ